MGIIELKDGYMLLTYNMTVYATDKTFDIMARKIQKWWKPLYYRLLIQKARNQRNSNHNIKIKNKSKYATDTIMARKIQRWWKALYYRLLIQKENNKRTIMARKIQRWWKPLYCKSLVQKENNRKIKNKSKNKHDNKYTRKRK
jgi:hypothetical protein